MSVSSDDVVLRIEDVTKRFGTLEVMKGVSLSLQKGERHALIGPNGAGKSTIFNMISGEFPPSEGAIYLNNRRISGLQPSAINRMGLARSFQITNVFGRLSAFENIRMGVLSQHGRRFDLMRAVAGLRDINDEAMALLERVRLGDKADVPAGDLPYSEQRSLEIGMTLSTGADLILLDEPTAGMSRDETRYIVGLIREVTEDKTLLVVEHDMGVVFDLCDRISVLVYGEIIATDAPEAIRANRGVQEAYLGEEVA
jgi:branched-chain amino acid transport system ATP-binding protein